jgi:hypothetical protein
MDYKNYLEKKESGNASLVKINNNFALSFKKYSPETGEEETPDIRALSKKELEDEKQRLTDEIAGIDSVIKEMDSLVEVK